MIEAIGVVTRSLSSVLERVWVNYLMGLLLLLIPEQTLSKKGWLHSTLIVLMLTFTVLFVRDVLIEWFSLKNVTPTNSLVLNQEKNYPLSYKPLIRNSK